jgi:hypothetical protein
MVGPKAGPTFDGASTYSNIDFAPLSRHYHRLPAGSKLPEGLAVIADGRDIAPQSHHGPTHHTIYPTALMTFQRFVELYLGLPWEYGGRK